MKFVVIGGTGLIGSKVVSRLREQGHEAVAAAPSTGVNILTGEGLDTAMAGADAVVDLANSPSFEDAAVMDFFQTAGRNVLAAEARAGVGHHLALSVVGTEKLSASGYFRAKSAQEELIRASGLPYTIVHSTQFFEFLPGIIQSGSEGDTVRLPTALIQPIASEDVAAAVARLALQAPANGIVEIAGPVREPLSDLAQRFMNIVQDPREVVGDAHARYFGAELQNDTLVPAGPAWQGALNFEHWLEQSEYARYVPRA
ncbi:MULTISPECIES: SDR family oxidoreductase [unclassified Lysobacter]|uniref:SDR family oxidoreductase n=1 Tax=unclassified Lysobacter TaxID=2635362 RepID=UPI0006FF5E09|nr:MULTISPECIES: SDR family oxidoreductase [unclassified Lysobacter]KRA17377.1 NmrA family transcriptional regulator [Lysobacter sp. Root604]KRD77062.1 NmrA family transcriptional regulator [Lysobacter sp. Root983]